MADGVIVGLVDDRGRLLMQERDENAPVDPNRWSLVGGQVESGESTHAAARRELEEETGIVTEDLRTLGTHTLPCAVHGEDNLELFTAPTSVTDADVHCGEGRQIIFINPDEIEDLDLTSATRSLYRTVLAAHPRRVSATPVTARQPELPQFDRLFLEAAPCIDAKNTAQPVLVESLDAADAQARWPGFARDAVILHAGAEFAFPMVAAGKPFAVLQTYRLDSGRLSQQQLADGERLLDASNEPILDELDQHLFRRPAGRPTGVQ